MKMKFIVLFALLPFVVFARPVTVSLLPPNEYADTEVSTNIAFIVERPAMTRIEFTVALDATPTNNVEVAIGTDANGDGNLGVEEQAYAFGWDCGAWFVRDRDQGWDLSTPRSEDAAGTVLIGAECPTPRARIEKTFALKRHQLDAAWDLVKVTRRGCGATCELVKAVGRKPGFKLEVR